MHGKGRAVPGVPPSRPMQVLALSVVMAASLGQEAKGQTTQPADSIPHSAEKDSLLHRSSIVHTYLPLSMSGGRFVVPVAHAANLVEGTEGIRRLVVGIHGVGPYVHEAYVDYMLLSASRSEPLEKVLGHTTVLAPNFLRDFQAREDEPKDLIVWRSRPFWGESDARDGNGVASDVSSFEVLDGILDHYGAPGYLPGLEEVVVWGFSAGGQMVNTYAAASQAHRRLRERGIRVWYVVAAASNYLYFSPHRVAPGSVDDFRLVRPHEVLVSPRFHQWGRGLEVMERYAQAVGEGELQRRFAEREVYLVCGADDNDPQHPSLSRNIEWGAQLQGPSRLDRTQIYWNYLRFYFGEAGVANKGFFIIPEADHSSRPLIDSPIFRTLLFGEPASLRPATSHRALQGGSIRGRSP
jgi:hypothetical protein